MKEDSLPVLQHRPMARGSRQESGTADEKKDLLSSRRSDPNAEADSDVNVDGMETAGAFLELFPNWASIARSFFCKRGIRAKAWCLSISTIFLVLVQVSIIVGFSYANRNFNTALQKKDRDGFYFSVAVFLGLILAACPLFTLGTYVEGYVALVWREHLTQSFLTNYYSKKNYYHLKTHVEIDNPDQRITDDITDFVDTSVKIITLLVKAIAYISAFTGVLFSISSVLVAFLLIYSSVGVGIAVYCFGRKLMELKRTALEREATFRFSLVRVRENAESVAFYGGGERESGESNGLFSSLLTTLLSQLKWLAGLQFFNTNFQYITFVLPPLIIAPLYFDGQVEFGVIPQASMAFGTIRSNLALLANNLATFASLGATAARLVNLRNSLDEDPVPEGEHIVRKRLKRRDDDDEGDDDDKPKKNKGKDSKVLAGTDHKGENMEMLNLASESQVSVRGESSSETLVDPEGNSLIVSRLKLKTPDGRRELVRDLSLALKPGNALLIIGPSGCGKSSLLRCFAGLWGRGGGLIAMRGKPPLDSDKTKNEEEDSSAAPSNGLMGKENAGGANGSLGKCRDSAKGGNESRIAFVPQKPYMALFGTLREQLMFPTPVPSKSCTEPIGEDPLGPSRCHSTENIPEDSNKYKAFEAYENGIPTSRFRKALKSAALGDLMDRHNLDDKIAWEDVLSLGQQQRLTLARLFLKDDFSLAFLDEATSACDSVTERHVYTAIQAHIPTFISIAHRVRSLLKFHTHVLQCQVKDDGNHWSFMTKDQFRSKQAEAKMNGQATVDEL